MGDLATGDVAKFQNVCGEEVFGVHCSRELVYLRKQRVKEISLGVDWRRRGIVGG
jgi:hypothetical protein